MFAKAWTSSITQVNLIRGFASTGIHPFNPQAIPKEAFIACSTSLEAQMTGTTQNTHVESLPGKI